MINSIYELSSLKNRDGRREIKLILHEVFPSADTWQDNGISWSEQYTLDNIETINGMSLCAEFINSDRSQPYGHGLTDVVDNMPLFEDATMIGVFHRAYIDDIEINGVKKRVLMAEGHIDEMRYPNFVKWLESEMEKGSVKGSVEIIGTEEFDNKIVYDGGWKEKGRVPMKYRYSGYAILGIKPADDTAVVIELNNKTILPKEDDNKMDENTLNQFVSEIKAALCEGITESNTGKKDYEDKIDALNAEIAAKNEEITELKGKCEKCEKDIITLTDENTKLSAAQKNSELNAALSKFTDTEQNFAKTEIEAFRAEPSKYEVDAIINKICTEIVNAAKSKKHEQNSASDDIFGFMNDADNGGDSSSDIF